MRYPAFRPRGQEIQVGDMVRRLRHRELGMGGIGIVHAVYTDGSGSIMVLWDGELLRADKSIMEVCNEAR